MSRSRRKPYIKDSTRCNKYWKRQATKALRRAKDAISGMFYKKLFCCWTWCDYCWFAPDEKKPIGNKFDYCFNKCYNEIRRENIVTYNIFFISDLHFGHENMCKFVDYDGNKVRPFNNASECDELMIQNWNEMIKPTDKVYVLGDVSMNKNIADKIMPRLNGKKCLIRGNHDTFVLKWYALWFYDIRGCHNFENFLMTHVPVHPDSKARFKMNIHGHLHRGYVYKHNKHGEITKIKDPWYRNVCVDANDYKPVPYEQIQHEFSVYKQRGEIILPPKMSKEQRMGEI